MDQKLITKDGVGVNLLFNETQLTYMAAGFFVVSFVSVFLALILANKIQSN